MVVPIRVEQVNGHFSAELVGDPTVRVEAPSRAAVLGRMQAELAQRIRTGEIVLLDVPVTGFVDFVGILKDDPTIEDLVKEIYRQRDLEPYPDSE
jgi:hypothetical protein